MQRIALSRMGTWLTDTWQDTTQGWANYGSFGLLSIGLHIANGFVNQLLGCTFRNAALLMLTSFVLQTLVNAVVEMGLVGVATARLHGREGTELDFRQDVSVLGQCILAQLTVYATMILLVAVAALPGLAILVPAGMQNNNAAIIPGALLTIGGLILGILIASALTMFTVPLVVEKRLDFWTALGMSVDCARRDLLGLIVYLFLLNLTISMAIFFTCLLGTPIAIAAREALVMRAYRDYFGMGVDHTAPPQVSGYSSYGNPPQEPWESSMGGRGYSANSAPLIDPPRHPHGFPPPPSANPTEPIRPPSLPIIPLPPLPEEKRYAHLDKHPYELNDDDKLPPPPPPA